MIKKLKLAKLIYKIEFLTVDCDNNKIKIQIIKQYLTIKLEINLNVHLEYFTKSIIN